MAVQLTLKAMELDKIKFDEFARNDNVKIEEQNKFNAKQIADFVLNIAESLQS